MYKGNLLTTQTIHQLGQHKMCLDLIYLQKYITEQISIFYEIN